MTIAECYNGAAAKLLPHMDDEPAVDHEITNANHFGEIVLRRSEFLGGMAVAILAMIERKG